MSSNISLTLSKLSLPVLNTVLTNRGQSFHIAKVDAIKAVRDLIDTGVVTLSEVETTVPSQASSPRSGASRLPPRCPHLQASRKRPPLGPRGKQLSRGQRTPQRVQPQYDRLAEFPPR